MSGADAASTCPEACLREVRKVYRMGGQEVPALRGITLEFEPGSFWAIMGPSGSGKSTLLNILGCLDRPTSGRYLLQGEDVGTLDDDTLSELRLRRLGFLGQKFLQALLCLFIVAAQFFRYRMNQLARTPVNVAYKIRYAVLYEMNTGRRETYIN